MADRELKIKVTAGVKPLKDLQAELRKSKEDLARLELQGKANTKEYKEQAQYVHALNSQYKQLQASSKDAAQGIDSGSKSITDLSTKLGVAGIAVYALVGSFKKLYDIASAGAGFQTLYEGFVRLSGGVDMAEKNINALTQAAAGNLDAEELIQYANEMRSLGYSIETTTKLIDIAERKGDELGVTFEQSQNALQKFIQTGAERGLTDIGIQFVDIRKAIEEYTGATYDQFTQLDELTQQTVRAKVVTDKYGQSLDEIARKTKGNDDKVASLSSAYNNLWKLLEVGVANAFVTVTGNIETNTGSLNKNLEAVAKTGEKIGNFVNGVIELGAWLQKLSAYLSPVTTAINVMYDAFSGLVDKMREWIGLKSVIDIGKTFNEDFGETDLDIRTQNAINSIQARKKAAEDAALLKKKIDDEIKKLGQTGKTGSTGSTNSKIEKIVESELEKFFSKLLAGFSIENLSIAIQKVRPEFNLEKATFQIQSLPEDLLTQAAPNTDLEKINQKVQELPEEKTLGSRLQAAEALAGASNVLLDNIQSAMTTLGIGTSQFVNSIISGFNVVLSIMEAIKAVQTILNVIPFLATGGIMQSSGLAVVGERGPELVSLPAGARVYNNQDTQRYFNNVNSTPQAVNVYVNADIDGLQFLRKNMPKYFSDRNYKRIN